MFAFRSLAFGRPLTFSTENLSPSWRRNRRLDSENPITRTTDPIKKNKRPWSNWRKEKGAISSNLKLYWRFPVPYAISKKRMIWEVIHKARKWHVTFVYPVELRGSFDNLPQNINQCMRKQIDYPELNKRLLPMVIVSRISHQHSHQKYDRRIHMGKFPTNSKKKAILLPKTWDQIGRQFHSIKFPLNSKAHFAGKVGGIL